jgi:aspartyl-tRNA(Asn)/glutamyl-tRNA(Gln) amidotransferase subunit B
MRSTAEAVAYARELHKIVTWIGICDGNMQEGSFRCDANVSVRRPGERLGTRREIKNLNSFKFMQQAIDYEIRWQIEEIEDGRAVEQATVLFDPDTGETRAMRTKEDAADYRYFPDPDLPPLVIASEWIERVRGEMPELPRAMAERYVQSHGLSAYDAAQLTQSVALARYFDAAVEAGAAPKLASNWITGELARRLNAQDISIEQAPVGAVQLAQVIVRIADGTVSNNAARQLFEELWKAGSAADGTAAESVDALIDRLGLRQMNDSGALESIVDEVLAKNEKNIAEYRAGKDKAFNALVGQVMKASQGKANPAQVNALLKARLDR